MKRKYIIILITLVFPVFCFAQGIKIERDHLIISNHLDVARNLNVASNLTTRNLTVVEDAIIHNLIATATNATHLGGVAASGYALSSHTHPWSEVTGAPATATRWPTWTEVTSKPSVFAPSSHTHPWSEVIGAPTTATRWPTWGEVTSKPTTFAPSAHTHSGDDITTGTVASNRIANLPASQITSGVFVDARIPSLNASKIGSGVFSSARIGTATNATHLGGVAASGYALSSHTHPWSEVTGAPATAIRWPTWTEVTSKPTTFTPSSHSHGNITHDGKIGTTANRVIRTGSGGTLEAMSAGTTAQYLRGDGTWGTPPDTTYSEISTSEIDTGTASTSRTITGRRAKHIVDRAVAQSKAQKIESGSAPSTPTSSGTQGTIIYDSSEPGYLYICIAPNTWRRAQLFTW